MISAAVGVLNILWTLSLMSSIYMTFVFWKSRKNPLMNIFCIYVVLMSLSVLLSLMYYNDLTTAPHAFCVFQAFVLHFCAYATTITALCFSLQTYRIIVKNSREHRRTRLFYYSLCILYPSIMTAILAIVTVKYNVTISPCEMSCDIVDPVWARLVGYVGPSSVLSPLGMYWSGRAAYKVFRQINKLENDQRPNIKSKNRLTKKVSYKPNNEIQDIDHLEHPNSFGHPVDKNGQNLYPLLSLPISKSASNNTNTDEFDNSTYRSAAKRIILFGLGFLMLSIIASITTLLDIIDNRPFSPGINTGDVIGSLLGIGIFVIFGNSRKN